MNPPLGLAGFLAAVSLLSVGCGHRTKADMPEPVSQGSPAIDVPYTPMSVSAEPISESILSAADRAILEERVSFGYDQSELSESARENLSAKARILGAAPTLSLRVEGHADERGSDEYNLALSNRRSATAMRFLINHGVSADRLNAVGYGEEQPLDAAENESAWAQNRRAEFRVTAGNLAQQ